MVKRKSKIRQISKEKFFFLINELKTQTTNELLNLFSDKKKK